MKWLLILKSQNVPINKEKTRDVLMSLISNVSIWRMAMEIMVSVFIRLNIYFL